MPPSRTKNPSLAKRQEEAEEDHNCSPLRTSSSSSLRPALLLGALASIATSLQGCQLDIPRHDVANWQKKENYFEEFSYTAPSSNPARHGTSKLNSCSDDSLAPSLQCSGHGRCQNWFPAQDLGVNGTAVLEGGPRFCSCDRDWTDPECSTQRKSQLTAFLLSLGLGLAGADQFYLGWWRLGLLKLFTLGGCGVWWIFDIVRIGSSPVVTSDSFRVANDVEHWAYVLVLLCFLGVVGFSLSIWSIHRQRVQKARELMLLSLEGGVPMGYGAAAHQVPMTAPSWQPQPAEANFRGYATTLGGGAVMQRSPYAAAP